MNKKILAPLMFILTISITFIISAGCDKEPDKDDLPTLEININNDSTSTLKHIYWLSDVSSGVLDIDVPPDTQQKISIAMWPGEIFQFMITTSDTDQYVKWEDVESELGYPYLGIVTFDVELFVSCKLEAWFMETSGLAPTDAYSVENTLPSI